MQLVFLDTETTGLDPNTCDLIELSAIRIQNGHIVDKFDSLIRPQGNIPQEIVDLTGISNEEAKNAPFLCEARKTFIEQFLHQEDIIVAHNVAFDIGFLNHNGFDIQNPTIDTFEIAQIIIPDSEGFSLEFLASTFAIEHKNAHRGLADVYAMYEIWKKLQEITREKWPEQLLKNIKNILRMSLWPGKIFFDDLKIKKEKTVEQEEETEDDTEDLAYTKPLAEKKEKPRQISIFDAIEAVQIEKITSGNKTQKNIIIDEKTRQISEQMVELIKKNKKNIFEIEPPTNNLICQALAAKNLAEKHQNEKIGLCFRNKNRKEIENLINKINLNKIKYSFFDQPKNYVCHKKWSWFIQKNYFSNSETTCALKIMRNLELEQSGHIAKLKLQKEEYEIFQNYLTSEEHDDCQDVCKAKAAIEESKKSQLVFFPHSAIQTFAGDHLIIADADHLDDLLTHIAEIASDSQKFENYAKKFNSVLQNNFFDGLFFGFGLIAQFVRERVGDSSYPESIKITPELENTIEFQNFRDGFHEAKNELNILFPNEKEMYIELDKWHEFFSYTTQENEVKFLTVTPENNISCSRVPIDLSEKLEQLCSDKKSISIVAEAFANRNDDVEKKLFAFNCDDFCFNYLKSDFDFAAARIIGFQDIKKDDEKNPQKIATLISKAFFEQDGDMMVILTSQNFTISIAEELAKSQKIPFLSYLGGSINRTINTFLKIEERKMLLVPQNVILKNPLHEEIAFSSFFLQKLSFDPPGKIILEERKKLHKNEFHDFVLPRSVYNFKKVFYLAVKQNKPFTFYIADPKITQQTSWSKKYIDELPKEVKFEII